MANAEREPVKHDTVMDVTEERIARVYAKAFLAAADKTPDADGLVEQVQSFVDDVLKRIPALEETFRSSLVSQEQKERLLDRALGGRASDTVLNFLKVLSKHGRLQLLRPIARAVAKLHANERGLTEVEIRVASPLNDGLRQEIHDKLRKSLGREPMLQVRVDPSLIAGIVIRIGDRVYDGSVATQFNMVRKAMIDRATERIEFQPEKFLL